MFRRFVIMVGVLFLVCSHGWAFSEIQNESSFLEIQSQVFNLVNQNWVTNDIFVEMLNEPSLENQEKFFQAAEKFCRQSSMLGDFLVSAIQNQDLRKVEIVSEIYKSFDPIARQAFYPALRKLEFEALQLSEGSQDSNSAKFTRSRFREYFPGYGSTEPGYKYKKGKEISREIIGVTWENGKRSIVPGPVEITIDVNLLEILQNLESLGVIKNLSALKKFETTICGKQMTALRVSFCVLKAFSFNVCRKLKVNKIWYELLRAKTIGWQMGKWEVRGKTYEINYFPSGEEIITKILR